MQNFIYKDIALYDDEIVTKYNNWLVLRVRICVFTLEKCNTTKEARGVSVG